MERKGRDQKLWKKPYQIHIPNYFKNIIQKFSWGVLQIVGFQVEKSLKEKESLAIHWDSLGLNGLSATSHRCNKC